MLNEQILTKITQYMVWGDGSVGKLLVTQVQQPVLDSLEPTCETRYDTCMCAQHWVGGSLE